MLRDGQGMVIGVLIKEAADAVNQSKIPWLGNVRGIGWLFRRTETIKERTEIIVMLVPRIQPYDAKYQALSQRRAGEGQRAADAWSGRCT